MSWLPAVFVLGGLIFVHELGHFVAARLCGVEVEEFSLGFGPKLLGVRWRGTLYALRLFPILGYVRMAGMYPAANDGSEEAARSQAANARGSGFASRPLWQRVTVIAAGPMTNFVVAFALYAAAFGLVGLPVAPTLQIRAVESGMPAAAAGIRPGDRVVAVDGTPIHSWGALHTAIVRAVKATPGQPLQLVVRRGTAQRTLRVHPRLTASGPLIGVLPVLQIARLPPLRALWGAVLQTGTTVVQSLTALGSLIGSAVQHRPTQAKLVGPIGIGNAIDQASQVGAVAVMLLAALLSANLGLLNLLPIPALDGGRLAFLGIEWARGGRPVDPAKEGLVHFIGLALLMAMIVLVSVHDLGQLG